MRTTQKFVLVALLIAELMGASSLSPDTEDFLRDTMIEYDTIELVEKIHVEQPDAIIERRKRSRHTIER